MTKTLRGPATIPGIARRPEGFVRHVVYLAGATYEHTRRGVPVARIETRTTCYFGRGRFFRLFDLGLRVADTRSPVRAALWLLGGQLADEVER